MSNEALGVLVSGLIGAVIGALIGAKVAVVVATRQIRAGQTLQRRDELREVVAQFWGAADLLWEAKQDLGWTIYEMQADRQAGLNAEVQRDLEVRRQGNFGLITSAERDARRALAIMRLLFPELLTPAQRLFDESRKNFRISLDGDDKGAATKTVRGQTLKEFERSATACLKDHS